MAEPLSLFMIDDDPADIEIVRRYVDSFSDFEIRLTPFTDPRSFQEAFPARRADVILLDYLLAGGNDGLSMLKWIKSVSACPVIVLTGHGDERIAVEIMRAGADDYLIKADLSAETLRRAIRDTLARVRLVREKTAAETAARSSEERYRSVVEMAGDGIAVVQGGNFVYANPRLAQMMGCSTGDLIGTRFIDCFPEDARGKISKIHAERDSGGAVDRPFEMPFLRRDRRRLDAEVSARRILLENRPAALFIIRDVTERNAILKRIMSAKRAAEKANRAKSDFISVVSHELRTPLTSILGFTELLLQREQRILKTQSVADVGTILRNGRHLLRLIDEILDFKKIEEGRLDVLSAPAQLKAVIGEVADTVRPLVQGKPIRIDTSLPPAFPPVMTDAMRLRQVLINVVENSIKFTEKGCIGIELAPLRPSRKVIRIKITDTGIGIPKNKLKAIFRKFEQGHTGLTRKYGGAGLGLTISRSILRSLGGTITVKSEPEKGSEFRITLPFRPVVSAGDRRSRRGGKRRK